MKTSTRIVVGLIALSFAAPAGAQTAQPASGGARLGMPVGIAEGSADTPTQLHPPRIVRGTQVAPPELEATLSVEEVLSSVDRTYPLLAAAEQERAIAEGRALTSQGVFDLNLRMSDNIINGSYDSNRVNLGVDQAHPFLGVTSFAGYRLGAGAYPVYYGDRKTAEGGEFRAGLVMPLLRDRDIDRRRAGVRQAEIGRLLADPIVQRARIDYFRTATITYWNWVAAGHKLQLAEKLVKVAKDRNEGLQVQAKKGLIKGIEVTDNERAIMERQARLVGAERRIQQSAIALSLFLRDPVGTPLRPAATRLPAAFPPLFQPNLALIPSDIDLALRTRPELDRFRLLRERTNVDLQLAENQMLPGLNVAVTGAQDVGISKRDLDRTTYEAALFLDVPLQRRDARGRILTNRATLAQIGAQERFQRDTITAEVQDAVSALDRAFALVGRLEESARLAKMVEDGEAERLKQGASTVLFVNLRELATFDAQTLVVDALFEYARAHAEYRAALGLDARPDSLAHCLPQ